MHPKLLAWETRVAIYASAALVVLAISILLAFVSLRSEFGWMVKASTAVAAAVAAVLVVLNIAMYG